MKLVSALVGLAALGGIALSGTAASAAPVEIPAGYACNEWGHCWQRHYYGGGYYHPHYWGGHRWHRHWGYGGSYRWHHWHRWHHRHYWHYWHQW